MKSFDRDLVGYGQTSPNPKWPNKSKLAINFIVNVEEGSEYSPVLGDKKSEAGLSDVPGGRHTENPRDLGIESIYEYGSRVGFWRLTSLFDKYRIHTPILYVHLLYYKIKKYVIILKNLKMIFVVMGIGGKNIIN